ncbi:MAG: DNA polymerase/3'-5' exonuclease PolX [Syntrophales bacterium]
MRRNEEVADLLENIGHLLAIKGESSYKVRAYEEAARAIRVMSEDIDEVSKTERLEDIPGVGPSIAAKIKEYLETGRLQYYEDLKKQVKATATQLLEVPNIGPVRARLLYERLGISNMTELEKAAREGKLRNLPGFGPYLEKKIIRELERITQRTTRILLGVALPVAEQVAGFLKGHPAVKQIDPAGSIRRMKDTIGDIDILVSSDQPGEVIKAFTTLPITAEILAKGITKTSILTPENRQIDLRVVKPEDYGSALLYFTGSREHTLALREMAVARGLKLSEYGLFDQTGQRIAGTKEGEIYQAFGMDWIPPELRENRGEIEAAKKHKLPKLVELTDIKGDLQMHTSWSDGFDSPEKMVTEAIAKGYEYIAFTDHSQSLGIAGGMTPEVLKEQFRLIDQLNKRFKPFRIFRGAEVNIRTDGTLDYPDEVLAELEVVVAGVHGALGQAREKMTKRIVRALENPYVTLLSHPTGRILFRRPEVEIDLDAIIETAVRNHIALEINGQPERMDLDDIHARKAIDAGVMLVCNTDAHSARQFENMRFAVATARRGWAEERNILNTFSLDRLLETIQARRKKM